MTETRYRIRVPCCRGPCAPHARSLPPPWPPRTGRGGRCPSSPAGHSEMNCAYVDSSVRLRYTYCAHQVVVPVPGRVLLLLRAISRHVRVLSSHARLPFFVAREERTHTPTRDLTGASFHGEATGCALGLAPRLFPASLQPPCGHTASSARCAPGGAPGGLWSLRGALMAPEVGLGGRARAWVWPPLRLLAA